jgi:hypothetical protein
MKRLIFLTIVFLAGCTVGATLTNSPDTLPCAPGTGVQCR